MVKYSLTAQNETMLKGLAFAVAHSKNRFVLTV